MLINRGWKRTLGRALVVGSLAVGGSAALTPLAQASSSATLYVNGSTGSDSGNCQQSSSPCATISYALTQAPAHATIKVASGDYTQPLAISQPVTITGSGSNGGSATVIDPSTTLVTDTDTDSSNPQEVIVDVKGTTGVTLKGLEVSGSNAENDYDWPGCSDDFVGVYYHDASGTMTNVQVTDVELPTDLFGCQDGLAVYVASDSGDHSSVAMSGLNVNNYDKNGVTCDDAGTTCRLAGSQITGIGPTDLIAQNGFQGVDTKSVKLSHDAVSANSYTENSTVGTGLLIFDVGKVWASYNQLSSNDINGYFADDGTGPKEKAWTITHNTVTDATDNDPGNDGYGWGILLDSPTNSVSITHNTVRGSAAYGIALTGADKATISGNTVSGNGNDGIYVGGPGSSITDSSHDVVESNTANDNSGDGIHADTDSTDNTFSKNTAKQNVTYDLQDQGTGNTWMHNTCQPAHDSSPAGLCSSRSPRRQTSSAGRSDLAKSAPRPSFGGFEELVQGGALR